MSTSCELVNTYEVLEHVMGINGLHPHRLLTVRNMRIKLVRHVSEAAALADGVVVDIGCGSGAGTAELATAFANGQRVIGIDINAAAIDIARKSYADQSNLSFYHGDFKSFLHDHPDIGISAVICISVSMFIPDVHEFYRSIYRSLLVEGMFIDAPFMFKNQKTMDSAEFRRRTYAVCGCNMTMLGLPQLKSIIHDAGFTVVDCVEHDFELMHFRNLSADYSLRYLLRNFFRNIISPPDYFGKITSTYLCMRTLKIFAFFLRNRRHYAGGEFGAIKAG